MRPGSMQITRLGDVPYNERTTPPGGLFGAGFAVASISANKAGVVGPTGGVGGGGLLSSVNAFIRHASLQPSLNGFRPLSAAATEDASDVNKVCMIPSV